MQTVTLATLFEYKSERQVVWYAMSKESRMKNGQCPMCKSTEVYVNEVYNFMLEGYDTRPGKDERGYNLDTLCSGYMCKNCGFVALYAKSIDGKLDADFVEAEGWKKVS